MIIRYLDWILNTDDMKLLDSKKSKEPGFLWYTGNEHVTELYVDSKDRVFEVKYVNFGRFILSDKERSNVYAKYIGLYEGTVNNDN